MYCKESIFDFSSKVRGWADILSLSLCLEAVAVSISVSGVDREALGKRELLCSFSRSRAIAFVYLSAPGGEIDIKKKMLWLKNIFHFA